MKTRTKPQIAAILITSPLWLSLFLIGVLCGFIKTAFMAGMAWQNKL